LELALKLRKTARKKYQGSGIVPVGHDNYHIAKGTFILRVDIRTYPVLSTISSSQRFLNVWQPKFSYRKIQQDATVYQNFIIPYLYEGQHVSGDTPPIISSLKLNLQPLVFHTWKVVGRVVGGRCQAQYVPDNVHQLYVQQPSKYAKPEAASAVLGS